MTDTEKKPRGLANVLGYVGLALMWGILLLYVFAERIWGEKPAVLKWVVVGYGGLVLLGLLVSLVAGKRLDRIFALFALAIVAILLVVIPLVRDRPTVAAVEALIADLSQRGAEIERRADSLPPITEDLDRNELQKIVEQQSTQLLEQAEWAEDHYRRAEELLPKAGDKRRDLNQALAAYNEQSRVAKEKRDRWIAQARERIKSLKK